MSSNYRNGVYPKPTSSVSGGYKEENRNGHIGKSRSMNSENKEFRNKRVPLDGIELLLNREKIPDALGKRMDKKNIKESNYNSPAPKDNLLSDLDDIISDAESIQNDRRFNPHTRSRQKARMKRRVIKRKKHRMQEAEQNNFFPSSRFERTERPTERPSERHNRPPTPRPLSDEDNLQNEPNDDVSDIVSDGEHHHEDLKEGGESLNSDSGDDRSRSGDSDGSRSDLGSDYSGDSRSDSGSDDGMPSAEKKWRSPSEMTKDEIVSEKMDLLYRYGRLEGNGYKSGLNLNMRTPLETLRSEVNKLERMRNVQRSIRTQRKLLISFASGTEYCNKRYNPYKFALDGWSGEVLENIGDYDEVFEELHDKYKDSVQMAPELKLLTMVGGSGLMFHLSNTLFKSSTPQLNDILQKNPDIMAQIQREALNSMATTNSSDPIFGMMMQGINEKKRQAAQQPSWDGRPGYAPPRTTAGFTMPNPQASNMSTNVGANVNQVPQGQGIINAQRTMTGPDGFDDILSQLNSGNMAQTGLISDVEEDVAPAEVRNVSTKPVRKRRTRKPKGENVIDLDM